MLCYNYLKKTILYLFFIINSETPELNANIRFVSLRFGSESLKSSAEIEFFFILIFFKIFVDPFRPNRTIVTYPNIPLNPMDFKAKEALKLSSKNFKNSNRFGLIRFDLVRINFGSFTV
jgi:hypothetical protein